MSVIDSSVKSLPIAIPDYDLLGIALKQYLSNQSEFIDYNFDGSGLSIFLGTLSQNSHYNAFFLNQVANESFLSTAFKRSSVVSRAKSLSYTPSTIHSASAELQLEIIPVNGVYPSSFVIETPSFTSNLDNINFIFTASESLIINELNGRYLSEPFVVYEGKPFLLTSSITAETLQNGITLPNFNTDSESLIVRINDDNTTNFYQYEKVTNIVELKSDSRAYYLSENDNGLLNIKFGDNILGKTPDLNSPLFIEYKVSSGESANNITVFNYASNVINANVIVRVLSISSGGSAAESIESIKQNAPLFRTTQERAVTPADYSSIIKTKFQNVADIICYGGETVTPPKYGKAIIAIKPKNSLILTDLEKKNIISTISSYNVVGITPIIVELEYVFINIKSKVSYNKTLLTGGEVSLKSEVNSAISSYQSKYLDGFYRNFRYSLFTRFIDSSNYSIISNITTIQLEKQIIPTLNTRYLIESTFSAAIEPSSVHSSKFKYNGISGCFIDDNNGVLVIYNYSGLNKVIIANNIGTVNYNTGLISIPSITIEALETITNTKPITGELYLSFYANPVENDIISKENIVLQINKVDVFPIAIGGNR